MWSDTDERRRRRSSGGCVICVDGGPFDIIAETASCWVTAEPDAPLPGYVCVVARTHVVEPYKLPVAQQAAFWVDSMKVARAVAEVVQPVKTNYEIHGNTLPHLHLHLFPRHIDDPYVGGPVDPGRRPSTGARWSLRRCKQPLSPHLQMADPYLRRATRAPLRRIPVPPAAALRCGTGADCCYQRLTHGTGDGQRTPDELPTTTRPRSAPRPVEALAPVVIVGGRSRVACRAAVCTSRNGTSASQGTLMGAGPAAYWKCI